MANSFEEASRLLSIIIFKASFPTLDFSFCQAFSSASNTSVPILKFACKNNSLTLLEILLASIFLILYIILLSFALMKYLKLHYLNAYAFPVYNNQNPLKIKF